MTQLSTHRLAYSQNTLAIHLSIQICTHCSFTHLQYKHIGEINSPALTMSYTDHIYGAHKEHSLSAGNPKAGAGMRHESQSNLHHPQNKSEDRRQEEHTKAQQNRQTQVRLLNPGLTHNFQYSLQVNNAGDKQKPDSTTGRGKTTTATQSAATYKRKTGIRPRQIHTSPSTYDQDRPNTDTETNDLHRNVPGVETQRRRNINKKPGKTDSPRPPAHDQHRHNPGVNTDGMPRNRPRKNQQRLDYLLHRRLQTQHAGHNTDTPSRKTADHSESPNTIIAAKTETPPQLEEDQDHQRTRTVDCPKPTAINPKACSNDTSHHINREEAV